MRQAQILGALRDGPEACLELAVELARPFIVPPKKSRVARAPLPAPEPLARFFAALFPPASVGTVGKQDRLLAPSDWTLDEGKLRFAEENQGVCAWACDPSEADPRVYYRHRKGWEDEHIHLSAFLLRFAVAETIFGADAGESAPCLSDAKRDALLERMTLLPFPDARWPEAPTRFYARGDALALVSPNGEGVHSVFVAASTREDLAFLDDLVDGDWD